MAFLAKLFGALCLYYIYTEYYRVRQTADIFKFYDDSRELSAVFFSNPLDYFKIIIGYYEKEFFYDYFINMNHWDNSYESVITNESRVIIKLSSIFNIINNNVYAVNVLLFTLIGFIGNILILKAIDRIHPIKHFSYVFWSIMLFPSIFLWTSGILKEPIIFFGLGLLFYGIGNYYHTKKDLKKHILIIIIGLIILLKTKLYIFCCIAPSIVLLSLSLFFNKKASIISMIALPIILAIISFLHFSESNYDIINIISLKQQDFTNLATYNRAGSYFELPKINNHFFNFIISLPLGFINGLFRPFPLDINKLIHLLPFIENTLIYGALVYVVYIKTKSQTRLHKNAVILLFSATSFIILLYTLIGLTTPVIGAMVRYKIPATLFLIFIIYILFTYNEKTQKE